MRALLMMQQVRSYSLTKGHRNQLHCLCLCGSRGNEDAKKITFLWGEKRCVKYLNIFMNILNKKGNKERELDCSTKSSHNNKAASLEVWLVFLFIFFLYLLDLSCPLPSSSSRAPPCDVCSDKPADSQCHMTLDPRRPIPADLRPGPKSCVDS